jgi:GntR family transcriptional regulator/MocR family aminotransferase
MRIPIDRQSPVPLYQQIEAYFRQGILSGNLEPGMRLPSTRQLAQDLGVNRITVENAYAGLDADGLIASRVGSGTYILPHFSLPAAPEDDVRKSWPQWQQEIQARFGFEKESVLTERLKIEGQAEGTIINLGTGMGDPGLFPVEDFRKIIQKVMRRDGVAALDYGARQGYAPLRNTIAHVLANQGLRAHPGNILITAGSQQAIALVSQLLLKPGEVILVERPTYAGALDLFRVMGFSLVGIPMDKNGMRVGDLEKLIRQHDPKLIYTVPNFHNPTGTCLSGKRRRQLIALADRWEIPVLEDDFVGDLRYEGRAQPTLKSLDPGGRVIYASTFSKMLMPGLRVGFLVAEGPVYEALVNLKSFSDLATSSLVQRGVEAFVTVGRYQAHLRRSRHIYRKRRDAMLEAIRQHLPGGVGVEEPQGGLFVWVRLPGNLSAEELLPLARENGVNFTPGSVFYQPGKGGESELRLNFAAQPEEVIEAGVSRLGNAIRQAEQKTI